MEELYTQISEYLNTQQEEMVSLLKRIVNIESGPDQPQGANEILAIFKEEFDALGLASRVIEMENVGNVLVSEYTPEAVENDRPIVLSGHMDTVFQAGVLEEHAFRETEDNFAKGAGIVDMKGGLVIALHTLKALIHTGYKKHPIKMLFISDEETLHRYSNTNEVMLDELKGAAMLLNFEPALKPEQMTVSRKGAAMVRLDVEGIAAHSGSGVTLGRSAIVEMSHKIIELESETAIDRGKLINCGVIEGGVSSNTIPAHAKANFSVRFPNQETKDEILKDFEKAVSTHHIEGTSTRYEIEGLLEAMELTEEGEQLADHFIAVGAECGYGELEKYQSEGASDASLGVLAGVPTLCGMGVVGEGAHTMEEMADLDSLVKRTLLAASGISTY